MNNAGRANSPKIKGKYKDDILLIKRANPDLSGAKIRRSLEKIYPESKHIPKKRAIEKIIQTNRTVWENITPSVLDQPWSIGICAKYEIPPDIVPTLIECEKIEGKKFTIREARWMDRLKPAVYEMVKKEFPKDSPLGFLTNIAYQYSHKEKIYELMSPKSDTTDKEKVKDIQEVRFDTTELDNDIFFKTKTP